MLPCKRTRTKAHRCTCCTADATITSHLHGALVALHRGEFVINVLPFHTLRFDNPPPPPFEFLLIPFIYFSSSLISTLMSVIFPDIPQLMYNNTLTLKHMTCFSCTTHQSWFQNILMRCHFVSIVVKRQFRTPSSS